MKEISHVATRTNINLISVCSGYGGIELGLRSVIPTQTVCYVENELGVASILAARMADGSLDPAPIWSDVRTFDPEPWRGKVDILTSGFPCQPYSFAGSRLGEDDSRELSGEILRIATGLGYPTLFLENVPGILRFYWDSIRPQLRAMGYQVAEGLFTAEETGAPHKRKRLFILAHSYHTRLQGWGERRDSTREGDAWKGGSKLDSPPFFPPGPSDHEAWAYMLNVMPEAQPTFCRVVDGVTTRVEQRLRALGNGVVPAVAAVAFRTLREETTNIR
jgi:DNA (cytosine-5)-methyltransferase 1